MNNESDRLQWLIDFVPVWVGFDTWLTPLTCPVYLLVSTVLMYWIAQLWGQWRANRFMTLGLKPGLHWVDSRSRVFATVVMAIVCLNALALLNASRLTPDKLALVPPNPYPWTPAQVARHH
jgi:hypothetical protein